ncbi:ATP-binding protein [Streptomyces aculeolatus]|jgi:anti-sigma regulatory factor (Ser/Thr protein kinase)|uniref:ATP-binding protein n=1 Tax=Streptomyces aculeolatus TaxID=270689 RepID=UPI001CEC3F13|nr:ATP-binding protein [Streptomyces aculeolatus]
MGTEAAAVLAPLWRGLPPLDSGSVDGAASCAISGSHESVSGARAFTHTTLRHWELTDLSDDVALVVSELVTNALRHALTGCTEQDPAVRLHLMRWASRLVCAVRDPSTASPVAGVADVGAESGRGLYLVDSFSDSWGWHPLDGSLRGKVVWAVFHLHPPAAD